MRDDCLFCVMFKPLEAVAVALLPENVCEVHRQMSGIPEYLAAHPDGTHTATCGCMSLDDVRRQIERLDVMGSGDGTGW